MPALRNILNKCIIVICVATFAMMTVVGTYQIVTRYFFNSPSTISEELITYSFTWLSILAAALVFGSRGHLSMAFFYGKTTGRKRVCLDMLSEILIACTAILLLIYGGQYMVSSNMEQVTASLGIKMGYVYAVLPISGALIVVYAILNLIDMVKMWRSPDVAEYGRHDDEI